MGFRRKKKTFSQQQQAAKGDGNTLFNTAIIEASVALSKGPIRGFVEGPLESFYLDDTPVVSAGLVVIPEIELAWRTGTNTQAPIRNFSRGVPQVIDAPIDHDNPVVQAFTGDLDMVWVTGQITQLFSVVEGITRKAPLEIQISLSSGGGPMSKVHVLKYYDVTDTPFQQTYGINLPANSQNTWLIQLEKITPEPAEGSGINDFRWVSATTFSYSATDNLPGLAYAIARIGGEVYSSYPGAAFELYGLSQIPYPANNYQGQWTGALTKRYTNSPAWLLYWLLVQPRSDEGFGYRAEDLDLASFYTVGQRCQELLPSAEASDPPESRYTYNRYLSTEIDSTAWQEEIEAAMHAYLSPSGVKHTLIQDAPGAPEIQFTNYDCIVEVDESGVESDPVVYTYPDLTNIATKIDFTFMSTTSWEYETITVENLGAIDRFGYRPKGLRTDRAMPLAEAYRFARWELESALNQDVITFVTGEKGMYCRTGQLFSFYDDTLAETTGTYVRSVGLLTAARTDRLTLDFELRFTSTSGMLLSYTHPETGSVQTATIERIETATGADSRTLSVVYPATPLANEDVPIVGSQWVIRSETALVNSYRVTSLEPNDLLTEFKIVGVINSNQKWQYIDNLLGNEKGNFPSPNLSPPQPIENFRSQEELVVNAEQIVSKVSVFWTPATADIGRIYYWEVQVAEQGSNAWQSSFGQTASTNIEFVGFDPGTYEVRVRGVNINELEGPWVSYSFTVRRGADQIPNVTGLRFSDSGYVVTLLWDKLTAIRLESGVEVELRFTPQLDNPQWNDSVVIGRISAASTSFVVAGSIGSYLAKYRLIGGSRQEESTIAATTSRYSTLIERIDRYTNGLATWKELTGEDEMFGSVFLKPANAISEGLITFANISLSAGLLTQIQVAGTGFVLNPTERGYYFMTCYNTPPSGGRALLWGFALESLDLPNFPESTNFKRFQPAYSWYEAGVGPVRGSMPLLTSPNFVAPASGLISVELHLRGVCTADTNDSFNLTWMQQQ